MLAVTIEASARPKPLTRFYSLDALRGVAALGVVLWHWHLFYSTPDGGTLDFNRAQQPFFSVLFVFYNTGHAAVDLFFSLSGFIFFWLYSREVRIGAMTGRHFFVLRFSRLYPLHFLTLLLVIIGQDLFQRVAGKHFAIPYNDLYHFLLNLALLHSTGLEHGLSFNGPAWSISVEAALYALFFVLCTRFTPNALLLVSLAAVGFFAITKFHFPIGRGVGSFFMGGLAYSAYLFVLSSRARCTLTNTLIAVCLSLWIATISLSYLDIDLYHTKVGGLIRLPRTFDAAVLFPLTVLTLALIEHLYRVNLKPFAILGEISYSSYLLHFPLTCSRKTRPRGSL